MSQKQTTSGTVETDSEDENDVRYKSTIEDITEGENNETSNITGTANIPKTVEDDDISSGNSERDSNTVEDPPEDGNKVNAGNDDDREKRTLETTNDSDIDIRGKSTIEKNDERLKPRTSRLQTEETLEETNHVADKQQSRLIVMEDSVFTDDYQSSGFKCYNLGGNNPKASIDTDKRIAETVDDTAVEFNLAGVSISQAGGVLRRPHRIILKIISVKKSEHNTESPIKGLPMEPVVKKGSESIIFGRGVGVDVYLHDLLTSKQQMEMSVDYQAPFKLLIRNISQKKTIIVNGKQKVYQNQTNQIYNNDTFTLGCVTFLVELVKGDDGYKSYQLEFCDLTREHPRMRGPPVDEPRVSTSHNLNSNLFHTAPPSGIGYSMNYSGMFPTPSQLANNQCFPHYEGQRAYSPMPYYPVRGQPIPSFYPPHFSMAPPPTHGYQWFPTPMDPNAQNMLIAAQFQNMAIDSPYHPRHYENIQRPTGPPLSHRSPQQHDERQPLEGVQESEQKI